MEYRAGESAKSCDWWNGGLLVNDTTWREFDEAGRDVLSPCESSTGWRRGAGEGGVVVGGGVQGEDKQVLCHLQLFNHSSHDRDKFREK